MGNKTHRTLTRSRRPLLETDWNYHYGQHDNITPYLSDNKFRMAGRETGHFGSGTYFSTYSGPYDNQIKDIEKVDDKSNLDPQFIQIGQNLYRVDLDLYKNLYRVRYKKQGDVLYTMLANLNHFANRIAYLGYFHKNSAVYSNSDLYQKIRANAQGLGLKCPSYYELTRMAQKLGQDEGDRRSFSTVFMEYNGYNGVNVSGVDYYDNYKHGSVIYDLSKVEGEVEEIKPIRLYSGYGDQSYDDTVVKSGLDDPEIDALNGERIGWALNLDSFPKERVMRILKNYLDSGHILDFYEIERLDETIAKRYLKLIYLRNPQTRWNTPPCDEIINGKDKDWWAKLIEKLGAYYWVNYATRYNSGLINLLNLFTRNLSWDLTPEEEKQEKKNYLDKLLTYMNRELNDNEKYFIDECYFDE